MPDGIGKDSLLDSLEGIYASERGVNPSVGRTHPFAGWLFKDSVPMVPLDTEHDLDIHIELHRRFHQQCAIKHQLTAHATSHGGRAAR